MRYLSGIHALNLPCSLDTCGDWHTSALRWDDMSWRESDLSPFKEYGIERERDISFLGLRGIAIANHIRALLDMLADGNFVEAQGMRDDYIGNDKYNQEIFPLVLRLKDAPQWRQIDKFMGKEYMRKWDIFKRISEMKNPGEKSMVL